MNRPILKDPKLQQQLDEDGIVSFPLLNADEIKYLNELFLAMHPNRDADFLNNYYISLHSTDKAFKQKVHEELERIVLPKAKELLFPFKQMAYTFQMKGVGEKTELMIHQDWSITDEEQFKSYTFWIPLVDSHTDNGTLYTIRGSHTTMRGLRCGTIPVPFDNIKELVASKMKPEFVKAGHVLMFDSALVHYSPPNKTNTPRISVTTNMALQEADLRLYYRNPANPDGPVEIIAMPDKFFLSLFDLKKDDSKRPHIGEKTGEINYDFHQWDEQEFLQRFKAIKRKGWWAQLREILN